MSTVAVEDPLAILRLMFGDMPAIALTLLVASAAVWLIGGNVVFVRSLRRQGRSGWEVVNPLTLIGHRFSGREWLIMAMLGGISLVGMAFAMNWKSWW
jgi:hypothetical protein